MKPSIFDINGKKALVTGAGRGIGKSIAIGLADAGADVGLIARTMGELEAVASEIKDLGREATPVSYDLKDRWHSTTCRGTCI